LLRHPHTPAESQRSRWEMDQPLSMVRWVLFSQCTALSFAAGVSSKPFEKPCCVVALLLIQNRFYTQVTA